MTWIIWIVATLSTLFGIPPFSSPHGPPVAEPPPDAKLERSS